MKITGTHQKILLTILYEAGFAFNVTENTIVITDSVAPNNNEKVVLRFDEDGDLAEIKTNND